MAKPLAIDLAAAFKRDLREAWEEIRSSEDSEKIYAFGLYTTEEAGHFCPFACGKNGLRRVAEKYVREGHYVTREVAEEALKWSIADSPYQNKLPSERIAEELGKRPDPTALDLPETAAAKEIRARLEAATAALQELDEEGLFGTGTDRREITLLIEAGDRENEFVLKWAKKLNPPAVFNAYATLYEEPTVGRWSEFGTKKVYETKQLSVSGDRRLVATASQYVVVVFDVGMNKQLLCRPIPEKESYYSIEGVSISRNGERLGIIAVPGHDNAKPVLTILEGKGWKIQHDYKLPAKPLSLTGGPEGEWYAMGFSDNLVRVYGANGELRAVLEGHGHWPRAVSVSGDGTCLASIDEQSGVRVWRTTDWALTLEIKEARGTDVSFDLAGNRMVTARRWGRRLKDEVGKFVKIWEYPEGKLVKEHQIEDLWPEVARFSPDGRTIVSGCNRESGTEAVVIDAETGQIRERLRGPFDWFTDFAFLPERKAIAVAALGHTRRPLVLWELSVAEE